MTWELAYAAFGAPVVMVLAGFMLLLVHRAIERRDHRLYDDRGYPRVQGGPGRR